jgi:DNA-binding PadR family transcriptional regulator
MGQKEILILYLINSDPGIRSIYGLVKHFDRANFPAEIGKSIDVLLERKLVIVTKYFDNGTASEYGITDDGKKYLDKEFKKDEILKYIQTFDKPDILYLYVNR